MVLFRYVLAILDCEYIIAFIFYLSSVCKKEGLGRRLSESSPQASAMAEPALDRNAPAFVASAPADASARIASTSGDILSGVTSTPT